MLVHSWDTAIKADSDHDASACAVFARLADGTHQLRDMWVGRVEYPELKRTLIRLAERDRPHAILIEDKASGQSLIQDMRQAAGWPVIAVQPQGDKVTRFARITPMIEAGLIALPRYAPWLASFEAELLAFPNGAHDDQVDAFSQYCNWVRRRELGGNWRVRQV